MWRLLYGSDLPGPMGWQQAYIAVLVLGLTAIVSSLSYRYFEMPIRHWIKQDLLRSQAGEPRCLEKKTA